MGQQPCGCSRSDLAKSDKVPVDPPSSDQVCAAAALDVALQPGAVACVEVPILLRQAEGHPDVRIFLTPQRGSAVVGEIPNETEAECVGEWGEFLRVRWKQLEGWVGRKNVIHLGNSAFKKGGDITDAGIWSRETSSTEPSKEAIKVSLALRDLVARDEFSNLSKSSKTSSPFSSRQTPSSKTSSPFSNFSKASSDKSSLRRSARRRTSRSPSGPVKAQEFSFGEDFPGLVSSSEKQAAPDPPSAQDRSPLSPFVDTGNVGSSARTNLQQHSRSNSVTSVGSPKPHRMQEAQSLLANMLLVGDSPERRHSAPDVALPGDGPARDHARHHSAPAVADLPSSARIEGGSESSAELFAPAQGSLASESASPSEAARLQSLNGCMPWFPPSTDHKLRVGMRP